MRIFKEFHRVLKNRRIKFRTKLFSIELVKNEKADLSFALEFIIAYPLW